MRYLRGLASYGWPLFFLFSLSAGLAQDLRSVTSPDGRIQFRLIIAEPEPGALFRLAYQVLFHGKLLLDTSFLGLEIHNQEPILGANLGLTSSREGSGSHYHSLTAEYMQNGSLGRRLNIEARVYNDGVAFRYIVPVSLPLEDFLLDDECTEFSFVQDLGKTTSLALPFLTEQPGAGWVAITEVPAGKWPHTSLVRTEPKTLQTRLPRISSDPGLAMHARTPVTSSWRVLLIDSSRTHLFDSPLLNDLRQ